MALTVLEFTSELDPIASTSLDRVCQRFVDDENRALVWLIRAKALQAWSGQPEMASLLSGSDVGRRVASELAASFALNEQWDFDANDFRLSVESLIARRGCA